MKKLPLIIIFLLLPFRIFPLSLREWTFAEKMEMAESVGWGHLVQVGDTCVMKVTEVYKGQLSDREIVQYRHCGNIGDEVVCFKYPKKPKSSHSFRMEKVDKGSDKYIILQMLKDPAHILKHEYLLSSLDVLEFIGFQFQSLKVSSDKMPKLSTHFSKPYTLFPWKLKEEFTLLCSPSKAKEYQINVHSILPNSDLSDKIKRTMEWHYYKHIWPNEPLPEQFEIKIHAQDVKTVGTMTREQALGVISSALKSDSMKTVITALHAWGRMRDPSLIPSVLKFLDVNDVKRFKKLKLDSPFVKALDYLEYSLDPQIITPLLEKIKLYNLNSETERYMVSKFCSTLKRFQDVRIKQALEYAAAHNISGAYDALVKHGDKKSVDIIIKSISQSDEGYFTACHSLHKLVLRSNNEVQDWMDEPVFQKAKESIPKWIRWWKKNSSNFKLIM